MAHNRTGSFGSGVRRKSLKWPGRCGVWGCGGAVPSVLRQSDCGGVFEPAALLRRVLFSDLLGGSDKLFFY
jgi:hypothetical protein